MAQVADYRQTAPRRRRGRGLVIFLVVLLVLGGLLLAADRIAANVAEDEVTKRLVARAADRGVTAASTDVSIGGFPFLDQVARGKYDQVTITMRDATARNGNRDVKLDELVVVAHGVNADTGELMRGEGDISADTLTGTTVIGWADLATLADYSRYGLKNIKFAPDRDAIRVTGTTRLPVVNLEVQFNGSGKVTVRNGKLDLRVSDLRIERGDDLNVNVKALLPTVVDNLADQLSQAVTLPPLPFGLVITDVHPETAGLSVSAIGKGVPLNQ